MTSRKLTKMENARGLNVENAVRTRRHEEKPRSEAEQESRTRMSLKIKPRSHQIEVDECR